MSSIVVDYEELHRLSAVWGAAARALAAQGSAVALLAAEPAIAENAVFDPLGAARVEWHLAAVVTGPHGLLSVSARLGFDALALQAVVRKEQLVDDLPVAQLGRLAEWLAVAGFRLPFAPAATAHEGAADAVALLDAAATYLAPFSESILQTFSPSERFRSDVAARRPVEVDPILGVSLAAIAAAEPDGPGRVVPSARRWSWGSSPPASAATAIRRVGDLENADDALLAVQRVSAGDGSTRYVVLLPGVRTFAETPDPLDLPGALHALVDGSSAYTRCVGEALDAAGVPAGAPVLLVGHSQGGIVAMDLAGDPEFNGRRVHVTHVIAAGSPVSSKTAVGATRVLSVENVNDVVPHLDAVDAGSAVDAPPAASRLTYQFCDDQHDVSRNHDPELYATHLDALRDSPNPRLRQFRSGLAPYFSGETTTTVFALRDQ